MSNFIHALFLLRLSLLLHYRKTLSLGGGRPLALTTSPTVLSPSQPGGFAAFIFTDATSLPSQPPPSAFTSDTANVICWPWICTSWRSAVRSDCCAVMTSR